MIRVQGVVVKEKRDLHIIGSQYTPVNNVGKNTVMTAEIVMALSAPNVALQNILITTKCTHDKRAFLFPL